jgi:hypothetical protein
MDYKNDTALKKFGISQRPGNGLGVAVESMGLISYQRAYRHVISNGTSVTYPLMMAVIHVTRGKVTVRDYETKFLYGHYFSIDTTVPLTRQSFHGLKYNFDMQSVSWDDEACVWCTSKPSQCGQNVYDYKGVLQTSEGKACWLPDEQCAVTSIPNSNSTTTALCELSVRSTLTTLHYLYPPIPYICEERCLTFQTLDLISSLDLSGKVFITWTGTDSHGLYFKSAASRFSRMSSIQLAEFTTSRQAKKANDNMLRATVPTIAPTIAPTTI